MPKAKPEWTPYKAMNFRRDISGNRPFYLSKREGRVSTYNPLVILGIINPKKKKNKWFEWRGGK